MAPPFKSITLILSPFHVGKYNEAVGAGPLALVKHGILEAIQSTGFPVSTKNISPVDDFEGEIGKSFEILRQTAKLVKEAREEKSFPIILAGNCMSSVGVAAGLMPEDGDEELGCVWFDAHDDYHTAETMVSGYLDGTGVAMMAGETFQALVKTIPGHKPLDLKRFIYCGLRDVTEVETERVKAGGMEVVWGDKNLQKYVNFELELGKAVMKRHLENVLVHLDLDVLDLSLGKVNKFSCSGGLSEDDLKSCMARIVSLAFPVSLTLASFDPNLGDEEAISKIAIRAVEHFVQALSKR
jgi:arginase